MGAMLGSRVPNLYLLYVSAIPQSGAGFIDVYPGWIHAAHPPVLERIGGLDSPTSLAVDRSGTLYICQTGVGAPVLVFPFLASKPALKLDTKGTLPVSVAVAPNGTVFVSTAQNGNDTPGLLVYPPGATKPAMAFSQLAGDAVSSTRVDALGDVYYLGDFLGYGDYVGELKSRSTRHVVDFADATPVTGMALDADDNVLAENIDGRLTVYAHAKGSVLERLSIDGIEALNFNDDYSALYAADGLVYEYSYPAGHPIEEITSLAADDTFGLATYPQAPYAKPK